MSAYLPVPSGPRAEHADPPARVGSRALRVGLLVPLCVLAFVVLLQLIPALALGYALVLLLLLSVGPLAAASAQTKRQAVGAGLLAGMLSAVGAVAVFVLGVHVLGELRWGFVAPASSPPFPALPRPQLIRFLSWPHHYLLVVQPLLAVGFALAYVVMFGPRARLAAVLERLAASLPAPVRAKMIALLLIHAALTVAVGWIAFSVIEDMHLRGHRIQWQTHWQQHVSELTRILDTEEETLSRWLASGPGATPALTTHHERFVATLAHLREAGPHPGLWVSRATMAETAQRYETFLSRMLVAEAAVANAQDPLVAAEQLAHARDAVGRLAQAVTLDSVRMTDETDLAHHTNLIALLALVFATVASGLLFGRVAAEAITRPVGLVAGQLHQLSSGDFTGRIWAANRDELGALVTKVNEVTIDLDRLYRHQREAREAAEALAAREREVAAAKEFLAHTIVHDLKQPIGVIAGFTELLEHGHFGALQPKQAEVVAQLTTAAQRLQALTDDIVDAFRLEGSELSLDRVAESPLHLLETARANVVGPTMRRPVLTAAEDLPTLEVDRRLMLRVLGNLLANAYQHAGHDAQVRLTARRYGTTEILLQVEDDGPGVPQDDRERIFDRFTQGRGARSGSGLGLAFVRLVIARHGGRIWVDRSSLGGAQFNVVLPAGALMAERVPLYS